MRILLVDDHDLVRKSVRQLLERDPRWEVCGEAKNGDEAIEKALDLAPEAVILDLSLPTLVGLAVANAIRQVTPSSKIIFFSMMEPSSLSQIARQGDAFVAKISASTDLPLALERVLSRLGKSAGA